MCAYFTLKLIPSFLGRDHPCKPKVHHPPQTHQRQMVLYWLVLISTSEQQWQKKRWKYKPCCSSRAVKNFARVPAGWNYWSLMIFTAPPTVPLRLQVWLSTMWQNDIKKQQKQEMNNLTLVPTLFRVGPSEMFPLSQRWQQVSNCPSGPKHFTIFSKNCWTVENHLIRMTAHFFLSRFVLLLIPLYKTKQNKKRSSYSQNMSNSG